MTLQTRHSRAVSMGLLALMVASLAWACAAPPKPKELVNFESLRVSKEAEKLKTMEEARELMAQSDQFYALAMEKYDDEDLEDVKQYALMGTMKFRTAKALLDRKEARERMSEANDKYARFQDSRNEHNDRREQIEKTIAVLQEQIKLKETLAAKELQAETDAQKAAQAAAMKDRQLQAQEAVSAAKIKRTEAEGVKADQFAAGSYNRANNSLKAAERFMTEQDFVRAAQEADEAIRAFDKAITEAKPSFDKEQQTVARDETNKRLFEKAHSIYRDLVKIDGRGMVIIVPALFKTGKDKLDDNRLGDLDIIDKLAKEFPDYQLLIAGHTEKAGGAARNMTLSQGRAQAVRDYFLQRGIPASRMQTAGYGSDQPAFENRGRERFKNNRVEIIFLYR